jgi:hypothetical protein
LSAFVLRKLISFESSKFFYTFLAIDYNLLRPPKVFFASFDDWLLLPTNIIDFAVENYDVLEN